MLEAMYHEEDRALELTRGVLETARSLGIAQEQVAQVLAAHRVESAAKEGGAPGAHEEGPGYARQLARMYRAASVLGWSKEDAGKWLLSANGALDGKRPVELLEHADGVARLVSYLERYRG
ncbi:hypothetical protein GMST_01270 [Geomonas silvestris]|uniref:Antitoxin Xre/MbcA/ParS-like toxin-binding domain-containing protein n=1 Tax=Geomonas silvestris TaxID=2740184 RepID=A0A6V8MCV8_9BACT|nr:MbcA/ParS/Xre antitoxin family protein [Geomonas silvestris]GFO57802.1 hypothetical protein GMST_01270 [Geomonas silvestris]